MIKKCEISQKYGANKNAIFYGFAGHSGVDEVCEHASKVYALKNGFVYKILDDKRPANDGSGYWAVFIISRNPDGSYCEWQIGHLSKILCEVGDTVEPQTVIGEQGNRGQVFARGKVVTRAMQDAGDTRGSHRHWNKKILARRTQKEMRVNPGQYITSWGPEGKIYIDPEGYSYEVLNFNNGLNGSVDPMIDIDFGYRAVQGYFDLEQQVIKMGLEASSEALKYPSLWDEVSALLKSIASYFSKTR